ncbi:UDP-N-acetylmuramate--alanine ligase [Lachnospiraceae bacterium TWA4]|nr:UDP-N-acetylmuramate--alanine ligase [Lachnospiraceae bacterium TWA4]
MYQIDFKKPCKVYFIGIGGISMSGLAELLLDKGFEVTGSDRQKSDLTEKLKEKGAKIFYSQVASNIEHTDIDLVVYTAAIHEDHPELSKVREKKIPALTRAELLGEVMQNFDHSLAIAGTHGKTTTTSMVTHIYLAAKADPTISVGGMLDSIGGNFRLGKDGTFITEACEYTNSFLSFAPTVEAILNIEEDHMDFFKDLDDIRHSFRLFMERLQKKEDTVVINGEIKDLDELLKGLPNKVVTFGDGEFDYTAKNISYDALACGIFTLCTPKGEIQVELKVPGKHNILNALAAAAMCMEEGLSLEDVKTGLESFVGTHRRFEKKGTLKGITIIDDYAHHPQEIEATLTAAMKCKHNKVVCVFQSHTYTRTKAFLDDFAKALSIADEVVLAPIYAARETDTLGISSEDIATRIEALGTKATCFDTFDEIENYLLSHCSDGDLLITMGAGDIVKVGEELLGL